MNPSISMIQTALRNLGFAPGAIDGVYGDKTKAAVLDWIAAGGAAALKTTPAPVSTSNMILQGSKGYPVHEIVVHCSATRPEWMAGRGLADQVAEIRHWHVDGNGWNDIGYHWLIGRDGQLMSGRSETTIGAGVAGHNAGVIHICLIGGFGSAETDPFNRNFTSRQDLALRQQIEGISMRTKITRISGHNEYAAKACPGFNVSDFLKGA
jgi:peptidoglycan hydrolase-like protein with peptidoglycan-binding domain